MKILGIETSCDETAAAVVEDGRIVHTNIVVSQIHEHRQYGGVVPEIASRRHIENIVQVTDRALQQAHLTLQQVDAIAVTVAPGLIGSLLVGVNFAKGLAISSNKPLIPVHHIKAHIAANYLVSPELHPPFLCMVMSGGHSHIIEVLSHTSFGIVGRTRDDAVGEAYDKVGRVLGFDYPAGVLMDQAAQQGNPFAYDLPHPKIDGHPYDFSFSGLKTAVLNLVHRTRQKGLPLCIEDVAASFQQKVCDMIATRLISAAHALKYQTIVLAGGVSANHDIRSRMQLECDKHGFLLFMPPLEYCGDNAAMIATQGYYDFKANSIAGMDLNPVASLAIDQ